MRIAAQKINNRGIEVSRMKVRSTTEKYVKQLGQSCERLYDLGYLANPMFFDEDAFMTCLFDEFADIMPLCRNITTGSISLSDKQMKYVRKAIGPKHEAYDVLGIAIEAAQASQALSDLGEFLGKVRFKKKGDILLCRSSLAVSNHVYSSGKLNMDSPYLRECFYVQPDKHIEQFDYSLELLKEVLRSLGVDDKVYLYDTSVFLGKGFSIADDCEFLNLIISGDIEGTGKYASKLHEAVEKYYHDYYSTRTTIAECIKYEEQMFLNAIPNAIAAINEFRKEHPTYEEFFVDSSVVYWLAPGAAVAQFVPERDIYIGEDIASIGTTSVPLMNRLLGYSGSFMYRFDDNISDYEVVGMPVIMYVMSDGRRAPVEYYPASNLRRKTQTMSIPLVGNNDYVRRIHGVDEVCKALDIETLDTLGDEVAELVGVQYRIHADLFNKLVGMLVQSIFCVMCDYTLAGRKSPNHIHLGSEYSWVTDEIYADACAVAETFYGKLGF